MNRRLPVVLLLGLVAACAQLPPFAGGGEESRQVTVLIASGQRAARSPPDEQRRELAAATEAFARDRNAAARLRLALLLSLPGSAVNDDARAASLLEPLAAPAAAATPLNQFGALLHAQVAERIREQKRAQQLREQIDALRAVERNLMERAQPRTR